MMMQLSARSRTTSISYSFQPSSDSSISTSVVGEASSPLFTISSNSDRLYATPPPVPPSVNDGRMIAGSPVWSSAASASSTRSEEHTSELPSLMRISYAVFCLKKQNDRLRNKTTHINVKTTNNNQ